MGEITVLLRQVADGDRDALRSVFDIVYPELRRIAAARLARLRPGETVTPTVLVHEAFVRLIGTRELRLQDRRHFFACVARAMRLILVDDARRRSSQKRDAEPAALELAAELTPGRLPDDWLLDLDRALDELAAFNQRAREVVDLRFFVGLTAEEVAELLGASLATVNRDWQRARAFLLARIDR